jgi:type I restriction-modification system DNA methylase subunit
MFARLSQLLYSTQIPVCLWFLAKKKRKATPAVLVCLEKMS